MACCSTVLNDESRFLSRRRTLYEGNEMALLLQMCPLRISIGENCLRDRRRTLYKSDAIAVLLWVLLPMVFLKSVEFMSSGTLSRGSP